MTLQFTPEGENVSRIWTFLTYTIGYPIPSFVFIHRLDTPSRRF